jgi:hypothetical protein
VSPTRCIRLLPSPDPRLSPGLVTTALLFSHVTNGIWPDFVPNRVPSSANLTCANWNHLRQSPVNRRFRAIQGALQDWQGRAAPGLEGSIPSPRRGWKIEVLGSRRPQTSQLVPRTSCKTSQDILETSRPIAHSGGMSTVDPQPPLTRADVLTARPGRRAAAHARIHGPLPRPSRRSACPASRPRLAFLPSSLERLLRGDVFSTSVRTV